MCSTQSCRCLWHFFGLSSDNFYRNL